MSWLYSAKRRANQGLMQAVGSLPATEDPEFDIKYRNFSEHVNDVLKVQETMELWIESFDAFHAATSMLSESFGGFFNDSPYAGQSSPYQGASEGFAEVMAKVNSVIVPSVRQMFITRCLEPTASILAMVGPINTQIEEHKVAQLDFDFCRAKIEKEHALGRDSQHPKVVKKSALLDEAAKKLYALKLSIFSAFDEFEKARPITLGPEFCAFTACVFHVSNYSAEMTAKVVPQLPQMASSLYVLESFLGQNFTDLSRQARYPAGIHDGTVGNGSNSNNRSNSSSGDGGSGSSIPVQGNVHSQQQQQQLDGDESLAAAAAVVVPVVPVVTQRSEYAGGAYGNYGSEACSNGGNSGNRGNSNSGAQYAIMSSSTRMDEDDDQDDDEDDDEDAGRNVSTNIDNAATSRGYIEKEVVAVAAAAAEAEAAEATQEESSGLKFTQDPSRDWADGGHSDAAAATAAATGSAATPSSSSSSIPPKPPKPSGLSQSTKSVNVSTSTSVSAASIGSAVAGPSAVSSSSNAVGPTPAAAGDG